MSVLSSEMVSAERDINDVFDEILLTEESLTKQGYNEGYERGLAEGNIEGYQLGYGKGYELGKEFGDYYGTICYFLKTAHSRPAKQLLENLKHSIESFPKTNDPNVDILSEVTKIRTQFKRLKAVLRLHTERTGSGNEKKSEDLSF